MCQNIPVCYIGTAFVQLPIVSNYGYKSAQKYPDVDSIVYIALKLYTYATGKEIGYRK